ncbi:outer membrane lipoprotein carrier protein LolA [Sporolactobacillus sp. Y61]|uniref:Outer membrane lipoprotein carrier protein LolA n=1 Tax=Sporolactobacillus sp. Y61 TaxID=3160863 RepID=A0AAU8IGU2_9BACL
MKKWSSVGLITVLLLSVLLSACGAKSEKSVTGDLRKKMDRLSSYQADATMTFQHNGKKQTYKANISFQKPNQYRVALSDDKKTNKQMIIRNKDGVFVLTPELNKSYQFESTWPNNRSQAYLYHSVANDILNDPNPGFKAQDNKYIFDTKTNYNTTQLANQTITLKKDLTPDNVQVKDKDQNVIVSVKFTHFKVNPSLDKKTFDVRQNMTASQIEKGSRKTSAEKTSFKVQYPTARISGTKLSAMKPEVTQSGEKYVLQYGGKKPFTLIETKSKRGLSVVPTFASGDPANLGFAVGTAGERTLSWSEGGTDYFLASEKLTREEMTAIAQSVNGTVIK